jgi:hypothetical protein
LGFKIDSNRSEGIEKATAKERVYCRRNRHTCCTSGEISSTNMQFAKAAQQLRRTFEVFEELVTLFKGPSYRNILYEIDQNEKCFDVLKKSNLYQKAKNLEHFTETLLPKKIDEIESLVNDTQLYVKKNLWFYGNMVCTACNPIEVPFFKISEQGSSITSHVSNCAELLEMSEYEARASNAYTNIIEPFVKLVICQADKENDDEYKIESLDMNVIEERTKNFFHCYEKFDFTTPDCQAICTHKKIDKFEFPIKFFSTIGKALKILFEKMTEGGNIEDYYLTIKGKNFDEYVVDEPIIFYAPNDEFKKNKFENLTLKVDSDVGITLYNDHMAKMYISKKIEESINLLVVFTLSLLALF